MSEVIRRAVVELAVRQQAAQIKAPDISQIQQAVAVQQKAIDAQQQAAMEAEKAAKLEAKAQLERAAAYEKAQQQITSAAQAQNAAYNELFGASLRMGRGLAFLSSGSSETAQRMLQVVVAAQGVFDVVGGGLQVTKAYNEAVRTAGELAVASARAETARAGATVASTAAASASAGATASLSLVVKGLNAQLLALAKNPVVLAIAAIGLAVWAAVRAFDALTESEEEAAEAARKKADADRAVAEAMGLRIQQAEMARRSEMAEIEFLNTIPEKLARATAAREEAAKASQRAGDLETARLYANEGQHEQATKVLEHQMALRNQQLDAGREEIRLNQENAEAVARIADAKIREIELAQRRVQVADEELKRAKELETSARQQLGLLTSGEQGRLVRTIGALKLGKQVSDADLRLLVGQQGNIVGEESLLQREFARRTSNLQQQLGQFGVGLSGIDQQRQAAIEAGFADSALSQATGGQDPSQRIADLRQIKDATAQEATEAVNAVRQLLRQIIGELSQLEQEVTAQRHAAQTVGR